MNTFRTIRLPWVIASILLLMILVALLLELAACKPSDQDLPFQTIDMGIGGVGYGAKDPNLLIIGKPEEIDVPGLGVQVTNGLAQRLRTLDYQHNFAIIVLRGLLSAQSPKFTIDVLQITRGGDEVTSKAHFGVPDPGSSVNDAFSSPYQVVLVSKEGLWGKQIHFVLMVDNKPVAEASHFIP